MCGSVTEHTADFTNFVLEKTIKTWQHFMKSQQQTGVKVKNIPNKT